MHIENEFITNINSNDEYNTSYGNYEIISKDGTNTLVYPIVKWKRFWLLKF